MNIFIREMKANRKALIIWSVGVFLMIAMGMGKYAGLSSSQQSMNEIISKMPKVMRDVLGMGSFDLSKSSGYYGMLFLYLILMAAIHASILGSTIISKEERDKTTEFLFVKPTSRSKIITSKLAAALLNILIFNIVTLISSIIVVSMVSNGENITGDIIILMIGMFILQLVYMSIGLGVSAICKSPKTAASTANGIVLLTFMISVVTDMNEKLEILKYITPFKYYEAKNLMFGGGLDPIFVALSIVIILILLCVTYIFYRKKDLRV